jgi:hypothetical protein
MNRRLEPSEATTPKPRQPCRINAERDQPTTDASSCSISVSGMSSWRTCLTSSRVSAARRRSGRCGRLARPRSPQVVGSSDNPADSRSVRGLRGLRGRPGRPVQSDARSRLSRRHRPPRRRWPPG